MQELHDQAGCLQPCILGCHVDLQHACSLHISLSLQGYPQLPGFTVQVLSRSVSNATEPILQNIRVSFPKDKTRQRMDNHLLKPLVPSLRSGSALGLPHIVVVQDQLLSLPLWQKLLPDGRKVPPKQQHSLLKLLSLGITPALTYSCPNQMKAQGLLSGARQGILQSCPALFYPGPSARDTVRLHQSAPSNPQQECRSQTWGKQQYLDSVERLLKKVTQVRIWRTFVVQCCSPWLAEEEGD